MNYLRQFPARTLQLGLISAVLLSGCHLHFVKDDNPIYPNVSPDPNRFELNFTVKNGTNKTYEVGELIANIDVVFNTDHAPHSCIFEYELPLKRLEPDQQVVFEGFSIDDNAAPGDPCRCLKGSCAGRVVLSLKTAGGNVLSGTGKRYQITWQKSGDLEDVSVVHQG
ncbi:hypothetical protein [Motiliproteus sp.]|uniref:hypothetical protein n=1 Tax=Motiliproteus sp. TaxID=1898955 RepID=UPI003BA8D13B